MECKIIFSVEPSCSLDSGGQNGGLNGGLNDSNSGPQANKTDYQRIKVSFLIIDDKLKTIKMKYSDHLCENIFRMA